MPDCEQTLARDMGVARGSADVARSFRAKAWARLVARLLSRLLPSRAAIAILALGALIVGLSLGYTLTQHTVTLEVSGQVRTVRTHQTTPRAILGESGIALRDVDVIENDLDAPLAEGEAIVVHQARACMIEADGRVALHYTHSLTPRDVLSEVGIRVGPHDAVLVDGTRMDTADPLPAAEEAGRGPGLRAPSSSWAERTLHLLIRRAVPISVADGAVTYSLHTTAPTLAEALLEAGITLFQADRISPHLMSVVLPGMRVLIERSKPLTVVADNRAIATRTREGRVDQVLAQEGIRLGLKDYCLPETDTPISSGMEIRVIRVREELVYEDRPIEFETLWQADPELELDHRRIPQEGEEGIERRRIRIHFEDDVEIYRVEEEVWTAQPPKTRVMAYGTKIVERDLVTPEGPVTYWRKLRMKATSYTPSTCGKDPDHPQYGITRLGWKATKGVVAVDPRAISLRTEMYVPGYGFGTAADTGGAIKWRRIDLCYDDDNLVLWKKWVDVYLLSPAPPAREIQWIVPDWPPES